MRRYTIYEIGQRPDVWQAATAVTVAHHDNRPWPRLRIDEYLTGVA